jgi:hypothetical protein
MLNAMLKKLLLSLLLAISPLSASDPWTRADTLREVSYVLLCTADLLQTQQIRNTPGAHETNPILGSYPSNGTINTYFLVSAIIHVGVAYMLPTKYRIAYQELTIGFQVAVVLCNARIGLVIKW